MTLQGPEVMKADVQRRDSEYIGKKDFEYGVARKTTKKINDFSEEGHAKSWWDRVDARDKVLMVAARRKKIAVFLLYIL